MTKFKDIFRDKKDGGLSTASYVLLYALLAHVFYWKYLMPGNFGFATDTVAASYPVQVMGMRAIAENGSLPLWNPYIFSGMPLMASFSFHIIYPVNWIFFVLPVDFAMNYQYVVHTFLMGIFFFMFMRHLGISRPASFVGGLLFMFNAHFISLLYPGHGGKIFTMTWLPVAMLFLDRGLNEKPFYNLTIMGLMVGMLFYGGHIQILFYCGIALLCFLIMRLVADVRMRGYRWALKGAAGFAYAFALGALLYAVILLPAWEFKSYTHRAGGVVGASTYEFATSFSQPPEDMLYIPLQNPFGWGKYYGPDTPTTSDEFYRGRIGLRLSVDYFSVIGLLLALIGVVLVRNRYTWFFLGLACLTGFLALGMFNPFYIYVYKYIPGFSIFRVPYAIMILMPISLSGLAAFGLHRLFDIEKAGQKKTVSYIVIGLAAVAAVTLATAFSWSRSLESTGNWLLGFPWVQEMLWGDFSDLQQRLLFFVKNLYIFVIFLSVALITVFGYLKGIFKRKAFVLIVSVLVLAELWPIGWEFIKVIPVSSLEQKYFRETPEIKTMEADKDGMFRVFTLVTNNELLYRGIQTLSGYHPVQLGYYEKTLNNFSFNNQIIDMLNARYLMLPKDPEYDFSNYPDLAARKELNDRYELLADSDIFFYKNRFAMPRGWLVNKAWRVDDQDQALEIISDPRFRPMDTAVLTEDLPQDAGIDPASDLSGQKVEVTMFKPDSVEMKVAAPADSLFIASEVWYPGWKAYIDGKATKIFRTNYLLRGVVMPKGEHTLLMKFSPPLYVLGAALSMASLVFIGAVIGLPVYRKRKHA